VVGRGLHASAFKIVLLSDPTNRNPSAVAPNDASGKGSSGRQGLHGDHGPDNPGSQTIGGNDWTGPAPHARSVGPQRVPAPVRSPGAHCGPAGRLFSPPP